MRFVTKLLIGLLLLAPLCARAETVALALSGGGARGFAFIGILKAMEEAQLEPDLIVGTSMGAVLGGLYASGYSARELEAVALQTDWSSLFLDRPARRSLFLGRKESSAMHILSLRFRGFTPELPVALTNGQKLTELLFDLAHRAPYQPWRSFDDLRIPFRAVATDLISGQAVIFDRGDLSEAMRASISLPLVFTPYEMDSMLLADGGVVENIPVDVAHAQGATAVVAIDMSADLGVDEDLALPWELAGRVTTIMHLERNAQSRRAANLVITPDVGRHRASDFSGIAALIQGGYEAAQAQLPALRTLFSRRDSSVARGAGESFCSHTVYRRFRADGASLPPAGYAFTGVCHVPDSIVAALPQGRDGLAKLALLRQTYVDGGHVLAHATELEMTAGDTLHSRWDEGRIQSIRVAGLRRYKQGILLREFTQRPGELFDLRKARRGISQIYGSDLFESVTLAVLPSDSGVNLTLRARERESPQLRLGAGFSLERKGRGFAEFLNDNVLNFGAQLAVYGKYGEMDEEVRAALTFDRSPLKTPLDRALQSYLTTDLRVGWRREEFRFYDARHEPTGFYFFERTSQEAWLGRAFRRWSEISGGLLYRSVRAGGVVDEPTASMLLVAGRVRADTKDRYPFPTSGFAVNGQYEYAIKSRSEGRAFNRVIADGELYLPLHHRVVAHTRGEYAWNDRRLPLWGQFPLGGEESLLGTHEAEYYGSSRMAARGELRWDLLSRWMADAYLSAIYTVGAVSVESKPLPKPEQYLHGLGGSIGLSTFVGPLTLTVGHLLEGPHSSEFTHVYVNLGHRF